MPTGTWSIVSPSLCRSLKRRNGRRSGHSRLDGETRSYSADTTGGLTAPPFVGNAVSIAHRVGAEDFEALRKSFYRRIINIVFAIMGIVAVLTWTRNRHNWLFLWFGLWSLAHGLTFLTRLPTISYSCRIQSSTVPCRSATRSSIAR